MTSCGCHNVITWSHPFQCDGPGNQEGDKDHLSDSGSSPAEARLQRKDELLPEWVLTVNPILYWSLRTIRVGGYY